LLVMYPREHSKMCLQCIVDVTCHLQLGRYTKHGILGRRGMVLAGQV